VGELPEAVERRGADPGADRRRAEQELCAARTREIRPAQEISPSSGRSPPSRLRGAERHRWRHREARACVRAASLMRRREMISPRMALGSPLMRSTPPPQQQQQPTPPSSPAPSDGGGPCGLGWGASVAIAGGGRGSVGGDWRA